MAKVKEFTEQVESHLFNIYKAIGIDKPKNHKAILEFVANDVLETANPLNWDSVNVSTAFRKWLECNVQKDYFKVTHSGFCEDAQREEIRIHAGEHGHIVIYQDNDQLGFIIDIYGQDDIVNSLCIWEEDLLE
jgi:hypothetical protein